MKNEENNKLSEKEESNDFSEREEKEGNDAFLKNEENDNSENQKRQDNENAKQSRSKFSDSAKNVVFIGLFSALTAIGAFVRFPLGAMSFTLQFLFTALAGVLLGAKKGAISQAVYVFIGLIGVPIFTQGGGFGYVLQPSFGFLLGLIPSAFVIGKLTEKSKTFLSVALACLAGLGVLYLVGLPYMYAILTLYLSKTLSVWTAVKTGMLVYLPGDAVKIIVTTVISVPLLKNPVIERLSR